jgi:hypothetical protein
MQNDRSLLYCSFCFGSIYLKVMLDEILPACTLVVTKIWLEKVNELFNFTLENTRTVKERCVEFHRILSKDWKFVRTIKQTSNLPLE